MVKDVESKLNALVMGIVSLQLCSEDNGEHGKADGDGQTQVQVEQDGAGERYQPHQLDGSINTVSQQVRPGSHPVKWSRNNVKGDLVIPDQPCWTSAAWAHP